EIFIFFASFVLSFIFFVLVSKYKNRINFDFLPKKTKPITTVTPIKPSPTIKATPTLSFKKEELKIKILNGSGIVGKASEIKALLREKEYQEILTGNADNFDYEQSELQIKKSKTSVTSLIKSDLKDSITSFKETVLEEDEAADVIIIIGSDVK
ncbi:LytR C-terminal domain-containing protein, partial [Candidatus Roizmanbacteria bacterium]|nr:LytR C-terminal domain-containing protein [Candidatus Roizmanbacteria bacterium]